MAILCAFFMGHRESESYVFLKVWTVPGFLARFCTRSLSSRYLLFSHSYVTVVPLSSALQISLIFQYYCCHSNLFIWIYTLSVPTLQINSRLCIPRYKSGKI